MAKTKKRPAKSKKADKATVHPPLHLSNEDGFNPRSVPTVSGANRGEVAEQSASEPNVILTSRKAQENADLVGELWLKRIQKEGLPYFECPICTGQKEHFKTLKRAESHIKKEHPMRVKELKMRKQPKEFYTPQKKVESPKRTLADAIHPKYRAMVEAQLQQQKMLKPISDQARSLSVNGSTVMKLVAMTESQALQRVNSLNDSDLMAVAQLARNRGKRLLARAASKLCNDRGIDSSAKTREPSKKAMLIQEALRQAGSRANIQHG